MRVWRASTSIRLTRICSTSACEMRPAAARFDLVAQLSVVLEQPAAVDQELLLTQHVQIDFRDSQCHLLAGRVEIGLRRFTVFACAAAAVQVGRTAEQVPAQHRF